MFVRITFNTAEINRIILEVAMPFQYEKDLITLGNYTQVFSSYSPDMLDEIRNAVMDGTPIGNYIQLCHGDGYKLNQIRLCLREYVDKQYINTAMTARTLFMIRSIIKERKDVACLLPYIKKNNMISIDAESLEKVVQTVLLGADISKIDFIHLPKPSIDTVCEGLKLGYPMWLVLGTRQKYSNQKLRLLMRAMALGINIHPFLEGDWGLEQIGMILQQYVFVNLDVLFQHINHRVTTEQLLAVLALLKEGYDLSFICAKDKRGDLIFNMYQMYAIGKFYKEGIDPVGIITSDMSDSKIEKKLEDILSEKSKLSGSLGKRNKQ